MNTNILFTWDDEKEKLNTLKHKVSFKEASTVFVTDSNMLTIYDSEHSEYEDRWITIGLSSSLKILTVIHTNKQIDKHKVEIRIISSRKADKEEIKQYKEGVL